MRHLGEDELIDLAEGSTSPDSAPHLAACESCRRQLGELNAMIAAAADVGVPEPSPLFWDHLSARVREAVANEAPPASAPWAARWRSWRFAIPAGALAAVALVAAMTLRPTGLTPVASPGDSTPVAEAIPASDDLADDPSLILIADLAGDLDWDAAAEAGLTAGSATVDRAVMDLTPDERTELRRILKEELSKS